MSRYRRSYWRELAAVAGVILAALFRLWTGDWNEAPLRNQPQPLGLPPGVYRVERVVDGDTLLIDGHRRVRLQGVNSPETVKPDSPIEPWGPEATAFTKDFVHAAGGSLRFEVDGETTDQHGRYLAFAFRGEHSLNEELVRAGLARATLGYDFSSRQKERLRRAQQEAKRAGRGIWSSK
jgi:micrococcal nuclease